MPEPLKSFEGRQDLYDVAVRGTSVAGIIAARRLIAEVCGRTTVLHLAIYAERSLKVWPQDE